MNQDFNKDKEDGLRVMNDSSIHPIPPKKAEEGAAGRPGGERARAGAGSGASERTRPGNAGRPGQASGRMGQSSGQASGRMGQPSGQSAGRAGQPSGRDGASSSRGRNGRPGSRTAEEIAAARAEEGNARRTSLRQAREKAKKKRIRRIIVMIVAECFALAIIFGYAYMLRLRNQMPKPEFNQKAVANEDLDVETKERLKGYWTIAVFGVDARDNRTLNKDTNSDVNIICNINLETGEIKLVSLFRDTYLNISKDGNYNKFNQAYFVGGPEQAVAALNRNLDLNITDYMTFNWKAVADAINVLGGVDVELSKAEFYYINAFITETVKATGIGSTQLTHAGMNHLDGVQAVAYGRLRLMDTDYARTERQRKIIKLAFEKAKQADIETLNRVLGTVFPQVATSIWVDDIFVNLKSIGRYHLSETMGFPEARGDARMGNKGSCVIPQTLESNVTKLHQFLFGAEDYTPSSTVQSISKKIAADSGMYKEGNYIKSVSTEGGVIQPPKTSAASSEDSEEDEDEEEEYDYIYVLNADGEKVRKRIPRETDEDGEHIEPETDEDGIAIGWMLDEDGKLVRDGENEPDEEVRPGRRPGEAETDEDGNPIEEEENNRRPGEEEPNRRPGRPGDDEEDPDEDDEEDVNGRRPLSPLEPTEAGGPGGTSIRPGEEETNRGSLEGPSGSVRPGGNNSTGQTGNTNPSGTGNTNSGGMGVPGGTVPGGNSAPGGTSIPGSTTPGGNTSNGNTSGGNPSGGNTPGGTGAPGSSGAGSPGGTGTQGAGSPGGNTLSPVSGSSDGPGGNSGGDAPGIPGAQVQVVTPNPGEGTMAGPGQ